MGVMIPLNTARNTVGGRVAAETTTEWRVIGRNPTTGVLTGYATIAALKAAGDVVFPGLGGGAQLASLLIESTNAGGTAAGDDVFYAVNLAAAPTEEIDAMIFSGQTLIDLDVKNLWVQKVTGGDRLIIRGRY